MLPVACISDHTPRVFTRLRILACNFPCHDQRATFGRHKSALALAPPDALPLWHVS